MESGTMMYVYHDNPLNNDFLNVLTNSQLCANYHRKSIERNDPFVSLEAEKLHTPCDFFLSFV